VALELGRRGRARSVVGIAPGGGWERGSPEIRIVAWTYRVLVAGSRMIAGISHAEVVDLGGVGHAAMVDDPELVARTILDFTARHVGVQLAGTVE
jgi:hypothetical protein